MRVRFRLLVAVSVLSSVGCATIAGLDDLQETACETEDCEPVEPEGGAAGAGGAAGTAGTAGKGGQGGAGGAKAGSAGTAGSAGKAGGSSGAAGASGAGAGGVQGGQGGISGGGGVLAGASGSAGTAGTGGLSGGGGTAGKAGSTGCIPKTCKELNAECGSVSDGCTATPLNCGTCSNNLSCGVTTPSGVIPNVCGCVPSSYRCDGATLSQCTPDGQTYLLAANCGTPAQCDPGKPATGGSGGSGGAAGGSAGSAGGIGKAGAAGAGSAAVPGTCTTCAAGTTLCRGLQILTCAANTFSPKPNGLCASSAAAPGACDPSNGGTCRPCVPNAFSCNGSKLQQCDGAGTSLTDKETCASPFLCERSVYTGACAAPVCQTGERRCLGAKSQICSVNRDGFVDDQTCASAALCANGTCSPPVCATDQSKCDGNALQKCKADRTGYDTGTQCFAPTPACVASGNSAACGVRGPAIFQQLHASGYVHTTEVTNGQYKVFLSENPVLPKQSIECTGNTELGTPTTDADNLPRVNVDWCDAKAYCAWAGMQLCGVIGKPGEHVAPGMAADPKIDQWFAFCGGKDNTTYPYGSMHSDTACNGYVNTQMGGSQGTAPVVAGSKGGCVSAGVIFDMTGNVAEWEDSCVQYTSLADECLVRGGSYTAKTEFGDRCSSATSTPRSTKAADIGFRCCVQ